MTTTLIEEKQFPNCKVMVRHKTENEVYTPDPKRTETVCCTKQELIDLKAALKAQGIIV